MAKFKIGDRVLIEQDLFEDGDYYGCRNGAQATVVEIRSNSCVGVRTDGGRTDENYGVHVDGLQLLSKENRTVAKRTFMQIKATPDVKKGALWQEQCEDGTQPYEMINKATHYLGERNPGVYNKRSLVEEQPEWFVEVFKVEPQYMTAEELERYKAFLKLGAAKPIKFKQTRKGYSKNGKKLGRPVRVKE